LLSDDSYLLEGLQSADKTKTHPKAKDTTKCTHFYWKWKPLSVCLLLVIKIKTCIYILC